MISKLREIQNKESFSSRKDIMRLMNNAWQTLDIDIVKSYNQLLVTNAFNGLQLYLF